MYPGAHIFHATIRRRNRNDVLCVFREGQQAPFTAALRAIVRTPLCDFERQDHQTDDSSDPLERLHIDLEAARGTAGLLKRQRFIVVGMALERARKYVRLHQQRRRQHQRRATHGAARDRAGGAYRAGVGVGDFKIGVEDEHVIRQLIDGRFERRLRRRRRKCEHHQMLTGCRHQRFQLGQSRLLTADESPRQGAARTPVGIGKRANNGDDLGRGIRVEIASERCLDQSGRIGLGQA